MSEVTSTFELKRGSRAPGFSLPEGGGKLTHSLDSLLGGKQALVLIFACNHCPFVLHLAGDIGVLAGEYLERGVAFAAINANDVERYPADAPKEMAKFGGESGWNFPYLFDETQEVAKAFSAACTPDFYVFNAKGELTYLGQYDGSRPGNGVPISGADLRGALEATLRTGRADRVRMRPSSGCNIKWKPGNEPDYFG